MKCSDNWLFIGKKTKMDPYTTPCTKSNSMWIKDLKSKEQITPKAFKENIGEYPVFHRKGIFEHDIPDTKYIEASYI